MSNNARVADGGEIGAAQYFQALAAGVVPDVRHNPVLVKPEPGVRSQVVVLGQVDRALTELPWPERAERLWPVARAAYNSVARGADVVVIEGAGSPAEVNLARGDLANLRISRHARARAILVSDIDRGGAFAHLYGTWSLLRDADRARLGGFVLNRFQGDPALLAPGPEILQRLTGVPTIGVVPLVDHGLPDEDGAGSSPARGTGRRARIVRGPAASNLDEWWALRDASDCRWATTPGDLADAELVVVPGSKFPVADLAWLRASGVGDALVAAHCRGVPILAVCGGAQVLGEAIIDPHGVEMAGRHPGLGLLPAVTVFSATKQVHRTRARFRADLPAPWAALAGLEVEGYEVHFGSTVPRVPLPPVFSDGSGVVSGPVLAVYAHGLCEDPRVVQALVGRAPPRSLDDVFAGLADLVDRHLATSTLLALVGGGGGDP